MASADRRGGWAWRDGVGVGNGVAGLGGMEWVKGWLGRDGVGKGWLGREGWCGSGE